MGCTTQDVTDPKNPIYAEFCNVEGMTSEWKEFTLRFEQGKKATRVIFREENGVKVLLDDFKVYYEKTAVGSPNVLRHLFYTGTSFRHAGTRLKAQQSIMSMCINRTKSLIRC